MPRTNKLMSQQDQDQVIKGASVDELQSLSTTGFIQAKVGHRITFSAVGAVETINYFNGLTLLLTVTNTYSDATRTVLLSTERTA